MSRSLVLVALLLLPVCTEVWAQSASPAAQQAKRHFDAGLAAAKSATSESGFEAAIKEFEQAARLLPTWPDVFLNLGLMEEAVGRYGEAARSLRRYHKLAPEAVDAELNRMISECEYRALKDGSVLPDINALKDEITPLGKALLANDLPTVELLLAKGADVNVPAYSGGTPPLYCALHSENRVLIELLLSRGAVLNAVDSYGNSLLHKLLDDHGDKDKRKMLTLLIEKGIDVNVKNRSGETIFLLSVRDLKYHWKNPDVELPAFLHSLGSSLDVPDNSGNTALFIAAEMAVATEQILREKGRKMVRFLLDNGANPNQTRRGQPVVSSVVVANEFRRLFDDSLKDAVSKSRVDVVRMLVSAGADVNIGDKYGMAPLWYTVKVEDKEMAEMLLSVGADLDARSKDGDMVLHEASRRGKTSMVEFFIGKGADLEAEDGNGNTPLAVAQINNKKETAALLLANGASTKDLNLEAKDGGGHNALHWASFDGDLAAVEQLLDRGADLNARTKDGWTPLYRAACVGRRENRRVAELLIARGADINAKTAKGTTPIAGALEGRHLAMAEYLHSKGAVTTDEERAQFLPPDPKAVFKIKVGKTTWLGQAIEDDELETVKRLIAMGADVNLKDDLDSTYLGELLSYAKSAELEEARVEMIDLLLANGANPNGRYLRDIALGLVDSPIVLERLIKAGADVNAKDENGDSALHVAIRGAEKATFEMLAANGANLEARSQLGTPLQLAVRLGRKDIVELLLRLGAQTQDRDPNSHIGTCLEIAREYGYKEIEQLLLRSGAK